MNIEIHKIGSGDFYVAKKPEDCRDIVDLSAYNSAKELNQVITLGHVIAKPIK